jgi:hypothetical protein
MKKILFSILLISSLSYAQNKTTDSIKSVSDSITRSEYIKNYHNQLNIKLEISNEKQDYITTMLGNEARISPNLRFRYALGFNYKYLSLRLGLRSTVSNDNKIEKGNSDHYRLKMKLLFTNWSHRFEYNYVKGYYIKNSEDFAQNYKTISNNIQMPDLKTNIYSGTTAYKLNKNYSIRAVESQTEIQIKSAGSFIPSIDYWYYKICDSQKFIAPDGSEILRDTYSKFSGINTVINAGYYYTYIYKKNWYIHAYAAPGVGVDFYKVTTTTPESRFTDKSNSFVFSIQSGAAIGYNNEKFYGGLDYKNRHTYENYGVEQFQFNTSKNTFHIFIGYRFRPPKQVTRSVDYIEGKVPILKDIDQKKH